MATQPVSSVLGGTAAPLATATKSAGLGKDDFLRLLLTQMRNQDPLDPLKDNEFIAQLAQFSSLEGVQQLNTGINSMLVLQQVTQGAGLIGKKITFDIPGKTLPGSGLVDGVNVNNGQVQLVVGKQTVSMSQLRTIEAAK